MYVDNHERTVTQRLFKVLDREPRSFYSRYSKPGSKLGMNGQGSNQTVTLGNFMPDKLVMLFIHGMAHVVMYSFLYPCL